MLMNKDIIQGTDEWFAEKLGKPSASNASKIVTSSGKKSTQREGYLYTLAAERLTGLRADTFKSEAMDMGNEREDESRSMYELLTGESVERVGVIYANEDRKYLCSPDGICEKHGFGLELKNPLPKTMVGYLLANKVDAKYVVQIQFSLMVTGLSHWMYVAYSPGLSQLILKVERDEKLIEILRGETEMFCDDLDEIVAKLRKA